MSDPQNDQGDDLDRPSLKKSTSSSADAGQPSATDDLSIDEAERARRRKKKRAARRRAEAERAARQQEEQGDEEAPSDADADADADAPAPAGAPAEEDPNWWTPHAVLIALIVIGLIGFFQAYGKKPAKQDGEGRSALPTPHVLG